MKTGIFIDDTGTPSQKSKSKYDSGDWKTWVAMILNPQEKEELRSVITQLNKNLKKSIGASEFHFTEIFSGKKPYRQLSQLERLSIFELFAEVYNAFSFPIIVQSLTSDDVIRNKMQILTYLKTDNFDFSNNSDLALWFLLNKIREYIIENNYPLYAEIFVDSGRQKPNTKHKVGILKDITEKSDLTYLSSHAEPLIQFIDFIAFCVNRTRWIMMNDKRSEIDIKLLDIITYANFNIVNMPKIKVNPYEYSTEEYDNALRLAYDRNGNLDDETVEFIKRIKSRK